MTPEDYLRQEFKRLQNRLTEAESLLREWEAETHPVGYGEFFYEMSREVRTVSDKTVKFLGDTWQIGEKKLPNRTAWNEDLSTRLNDAGFGSGGAF
jgi:hypothetical protein